MKLHRIQALILKHFYINVNRIDRWFDIFYWPMLDLFIWGFASSYIEDISQYNILSMILGGIILWIFVWRSSQDIAVFVLEDFWSKNLYHIFSSPVKLIEHAISIMSIGLIRSFATFTVLSIVTFLLYSFNVFTLNIMFLAVSVLILSITAWSLGFFIASLIFRFGQRIQVLAWSAIWIIQPFSCVFYPYASLPEWAKPISKMLPTTYVFENMRNILQGLPVDKLSLVYAFFGSLIIFSLAVFYFILSFEKARQNGLLASAD